MIYLTMGLIAVALVALVLGLILFPNIEKMKLIVGVIVAALFIGAIIFTVIYKAAHTLPAGAKPIEKKDVSDKE